jgi:hypothetical protein
MCADQPHEASLRGLPRASPDARVELTPQRVLRILRGRREEKVQRRRGDKAFVNSHQFYHRVVINTSAAWVMVTECG